MAAWRGEILTRSPKACTEIIDKSIYAIACA